MAVGGPKALPAYTPVVDATSGDFRITNATSTCRPHHPHQNRDRETRTTAPGPELLSPVPHSFDRGRRMHGASEVPASKRSQTRADPPTRPRSVRRTRDRRDTGAPARGGAAGSAAIGHNGEER